MLLQVIVPGARSLLFLLVLATACGNGEGGEETSGAEQAQPEQEAGEAPAGADEEDSDNAPSEVAYAATREGLQRLMTDLLASVASGGDQERYERLMRSIRLPDHEAWFRAHFARQAARRLIREYEPINQEIGQMKGLLSRAVKDGLLGVDVERFRSADDDGATGYQSKALAAMTDRTPLYSVRLHDDPKKRSFHLWSFVHEGDTFRFVGKMKEVVRRKPPEKDGRDLYEFRVADARRLELAEQLEELEEDSE